MRKTHFILFAALLICAEVWGQKPQSMVFKERIVDLGTVSLSVKDTTIVFQYNNEGDTPLSIVQMYPGCTCMVPSYSTAPLLPGESDSFSVKYHLSDPGPFSKAVTITYSTPDSPDINIIRIGIKGTAIKADQD